MPVVNYDFTTVKRTPGLQTRGGNFEFKNRYLTAGAADKLCELRTVNRAIEVYPDAGGFRCFMCARDSGTSASIPSWVRRVCSQQATLKRFTQRPFSI
jgi:hypothetical protein